jgi:O-antigen ligase
MSWLLIGASVVSLFFWTNLQDPFDAPKSWAIFIAAAYLTGWVAFQGSTAFKDKTLRIAGILTAAFVVSFFVAFLFTGEKFVGFFGEHGRRTGFLTYFCLTVFFLSAALLFRTTNISNFDRVTLVVGPLIALYGFLQHFKIDPIKWVNPYNSVLSTLGNPDFAAAVLGIFVVLLFGIVLNTSKALQVRLYAGACMLLLGITIIFSQARQGLLAALIGVGVVILVLVWQKNKVFGLVLTGLGILSLPVGILGMLGHGPLGPVLYKASVTFRGDYWRAGINMFKHHILFGVGLDRYGAYFRQYRDATQSLRRGPDIISNAAHDVPIQLAATGGIFVLLTFILLFIFITWRGIVAIRKTSGVEQLVVASFLGAWITYEAQSFISIDNIGIAIWGWVLGGIVVGLSVVEQSDAQAGKAGKNVNEATLQSSKKIKNGKKRQVNLARKNESILQPVVSGLASTIALAIVVPLFLADSQAKYAPLYTKPNASNIDVYRVAVNKSLTYGFIDPYNKLLVATSLASAGEISQSIKYSQELIATDPRNYDALNLLATIYEQTKKEAQAVPLRRKMMELDPYNQKIILQLGKDLKATGDSAGAKAVIPLIDAFAPNTPEAAQAKSEFGA